MDADKPRVTYRCLFKAALPIIAPFAALGLMLSLLAFVQGSSRYRGELPTEDGVACQPMAGP